MCPRNYQTRKGLSKELYHYPCKPKGSYPCWDPAYLDPNYPRTGYKKNNLIAKVNGITSKINFKFYPKKGCQAIYGYLPTNFNYHELITTTNFTMILYGYFKPKISGFHTIYATADELLFINFGAGNAFECCRRNDTADKFANYVAWAIWGREKMKNELTVYFDRDVFYPIRLFVNNRDYHGQLKLTFTTQSNPDMISDFTDYFFLIDDSSDGCPGLINNDKVCADVDSSKFIDTKYITTQFQKDSLPVTKKIYFIGVPCNPSESLDTSTITSNCPPGIFYDPLAEKCVALTTTPSLSSSSYSSTLLSVSSEKSSSSVYSSFSIYITPSRFSRLLSSSSFTDSSSFLYCSRSSMLISTSSFIPATVPGSS